MDSMLHMLFGKVGDRCLFGLCPSNLVSCLELASIVTKRDTVVLYLTCWDSIQSSHE